MIIILVMMGGKKAETKNTLCDIKGNDYKLWKKIPILISKSFDCETQRTYTW